MTDVSTRSRAFLATALGAVALGVIVAGAGTIPEAADDGAPTAEHSTTTTVATTAEVATTSTAPPSTTTTTAPVPWGDLAGGPPRAAVTSTGVVLAVLRENADGTFVARTPCGGEATVTWHAAPGGPRRARSRTRR